MHTRLPLAILAMAVGLLIGSPLAAQQTRSVTVKPARPAALLELGDAYALVIGNNQYKHLPVLQTAVSDAAAVAELLRAKYDFADVRLLLNASRADILGALNRYRRDLGPEDRLLIYYAGHGDLDRLAERGYWLPVDAEADNDINWVSNARITDLMKAMLARHVMVVADSCYSGALTRGEDAEGKPPPGMDRMAWVARVAARRARTALVSGGLEPVVDGGRNGHSVFATAFLDVLRENEGLLDGQSLFDRLKGRVVVNAEQTPAYGNVRYAYHEGGDFIFAPRTVLAALPSQTAPVAPATPSAQGGSADPCLLIWPGIADSRLPSDFEIFLKAHPDCPMAPYARARLEALTKDTQVAARTPADEPVFAVEDRDETLAVLRNANVRAAPATSGEKLTTLHQGSTVAVTGKVADRDWLRVVLDDGRSGYIWARLLGEKPAEPSPAATPEPAKARASAPTKPTDPYQVALDALEVGSKAQARAALPVLARLEQVIGPSLTLLEKRAAAYYRLEAYDQAEAAYRAWIDRAPGDHPERKRMALGLFKAQRGEPSGPQVRQTGPQVGQSFRDCPECPEMVVLPAGSFTMGSPASEDKRLGREGPQHRVTIPASFAVGKYEITFAEWDVCVSAGGCNHRPDDQGWGRGRRPVIDVSWDDAKAYVAWLSDRTGHTYRLLSEAEWEYAARAGTTTRYSWGSDMGRGNANCFAGCYSQWGGMQTAPVGSFAANDFGLYDTHGNVLEWVEDCWHDNYAGAPSDGSAWTKGGCNYRVLRGGSWYEHWWDLRSAFRDRNTPGIRGNIYGFRVSRALSR